MVVYPQLYSCGYTTASTWTVLMGGLFGANAAKIGMFMVPASPQQATRRISIGIYDDDLLKVELDISTLEIAVRLSRNSNWQQIIAALQLLVLPVESNLVKSLFEDPLTERRFEVRGSMLLISPKNSHSSTSN